MSVCRIGYTNGCKCVECKKTRAAYMREWSARNADRINAKARERWKTDEVFREKKAEQKRRYYKKNKDRLKAKVMRRQWDKRDAYLAYQRAYAKKNSKKNVARAKVWKRANPDKARASSTESRAKRRAALCGGEIKSCAALIRKWKSHKYFICEDCRRKFVTKNALHVDHIIALSNGGAHAPENLQRLCVDCNLRKAAS